MSQRLSLKNVIKFGKREYREKKPLFLEILRVKSKSILKRGMLPSLNLKQIRMTFFVVIADYGDYLRIYSFTRDGVLIGGENVEKDLELIKSIKKATTLQYHIPKEKPKTTVNDITKHYQLEFKKILRRFNQLLGFDLKFPYIIVAHPDLKLRMGRMIGCAKSRNEDKLVVSLDAYKKDIFEVIAIREIIYLYLKDLIVLFQEIKGENVYWYDLAILFTNFFLKNEKNEFLRGIMEKTTLSFLSFDDGNKFYLSDKVIEVLRKNTKEYTTREINVLFPNIFTCLKIFKEYKIRLRYKGFANLFIGLCDSFLESNASGFFKPSLKVKYYRFHYNHFQKTLEMNQDSKKDAFLSLMFSLLSNQPTEMKSLSQLIQEINDFIKDPLIKQEIGNYPKLIDDAIREYIFDKLIKINLKHEINENKLEVEICIKNSSEHVFQDFTYNLSWKPRKRIILTQTEDKMKGIDLHDKLNRKYTFSFEMQGNITLICAISFSNPFDPQNRIKKNINFARIDL